MTGSTPSQQVHVHRFDCGTTLLAEPMPHLRSAAFCWQVPAGLQDEPEGRAGLAGVLCEMVQRGAGSRNSREVIETQDNLGLERSATVGSCATTFAAAMPSDSLQEALGLYADMLRRPHLPGEQLADAISLAIQERQSMNDELPSRMMAQLKKMHYGPIVGRSALGEIEDLRQIQQADIHDFFRDRFHPAGGVLAVAGNFDWQQLRDAVAGLLDGWHPRAAPRIIPATATPGMTHIDYHSEQTQIGISLPTLRYSDDPRYFAMRAGVGILGDGMSSRLFTEVREKLGLCYTVSASAHSLPAGGGMFVYAGTTTERAQQTLDVSLRVIDSFTDDLGIDELERLKVRMQSSIIMEQESSIARATAIVGDWMYLQRVVPRETLQAAFEAVTIEDVTDYWREVDWASACIATLGQSALSSQFVSA